MEQGELKIKDTFVIVLQNEILGEQMFIIDMYGYEHILKMKPERRLNIKKMSSMF